MAEKQQSIETSQETILRVQNTILSRLDVIERALRPPAHNTPYHSTPLHRTPYQQWLEEDEYGSEWNREDSYPPTNAPFPQFRAHPVFTSPHASTSFDRSSYPPTNASLPQPERRHTSFDSPHATTTQHSVTSTHPTTDHLNANTPQPPTSQNSLESPEPFPIKCAGHCLPSMEIEVAKLLPVEAVLNKFPKLQCESKIGTLAVKLAKVAIFGDEVLIKCTVMGGRGLPGLPSTELMELKRILFRLFPKYWVSRRQCGEFVSTQWGRHASGFG